MNNTPTSLESISVPLTPEKICIITPTKGRHKQLKCLLNTLSKQTVSLGRIIIADGGRDAKELVESFQDNLPVIWLDCPEPGQIAQRNFALKHLDTTCQAVAYIDDDLQFSTAAFEEIVNFWNEQPSTPGGVSFNITNMRPQPNSIFRKIFRMASRPYGVVWRSGYNAPISNLTENITTEWLLGGATLWRRDVLENNQVSRLPSNWAICEDLIFSFPISRKECLYVCAAATTLHVDNIPSIPTYQKSANQTKSAILWRFYFVCENPELSRLHFFWMILGQLFGRFLRIFQGKFSELGALSGTIQGLSICLKIVLLHRNINDEINR